MRVQGKVAVVTGGGSGMGRELVVQLAQKGCHVACCDINEIELDKTVQLAKKANSNVKISSSIVDVTDKERVERFSQDVLAQHGRCDLLFANAGLSAPGALIYDDKMTQTEIEQHEARWDHCFNVDFFGVLNCVRSFVNKIGKDGEEGYILITSSINGFWTWPEHGSYTAAKFGVRGLAEALLVEAAVKKPNLHIACIHPGGVKTNIVKNSFKEIEENDTNRDLQGEESGISKLHNRFSDVADLTAGEAASWILDGVDKNHTRILVGYDAILLDKMNRVNPHYSYEFYKALGREGVTNWDAGNPEEMHKQLQSVSPAGWLRVFIGGGFYNMFFLWPMIFLRHRRDPRFKVAVAALSFLFAKRFVASRM